MKQVTGNETRAALRAAIEATRAQGARVFISSNAPALAPDRRALIGEVPETLAELLPGMDRVAVLHYRVRGSTQTLFEVR